MNNQDFTSFLDGRRVFITGHTGFIGSWLTEWLLNVGAKVCGYSLDPDTRPNLYSLLDIHLRITDIRNDIANKEGLLKAMSNFHPEIVFHLAAQPIVLKSFDQPCKTFETNVMGTVNVLDVIRGIKGVRTVIVVTSDKSYHNNNWVYPYRETDPLGGNDPYSASKACADIVVNAYRESYFKDIGVGLSSVRAGNIIGGGDWAPNRIVPDIVRAIAADKPVRIRNPLAVRPWQHVLDPLAGMTLLAQRMWSDQARFSGAWNFGPAVGAEVSVQSLAQRFVKSWGRNRCKIAGGVSKSREEQYLQLDISKSRRELGWKPLYNIDRTVEKTVEWYKAYLGYTNSSMCQVTEAQIVSYQHEMFRQSLE